MAPLMSAGILYGIEFSVKIEQRNALTIDFNADGRLIRHRRCQCDFDEIRHNHLLNTASIDHGMLQWETQPYYQ